MQPFPAHEKIDRQFMGQESQTEGAAVSPGAFADMLARSSRALWCLAAAVLGRSDGADDVVQEAALTALGKLADLVRVDGFEAWMGQIVRFTALNTRRRHVHQWSAELTPGAEPVMSSDDATPLAEAVVAPDGTLREEQEAFDDHVQAALASLDDVARACLLLKVVAELGYKEISRLLDVPEGTAMSHVHRARRRLREQLTDAPGSLDSGRVGT